MLKTLLKNVHAIDPSIQLDEITDILCLDEKIQKVAPSINEEGCDAVYDLSGKILIPGMIDVHVHFRDPGYEYKETIETGMRAAAKGGFVAVLPMANTNPVCDDGSKINYLIKKAAYAPGRTRVIPLGACTKNLEGKELAEIGDMYFAGARAFSDDGKGIQNAGVMRKVLDYVKTFDAPVLSHCQINSLAENGVVNEGVASTRLGMAGWPAVAEEVQIARDVQLAKLTSCHVHIQHVTTKKAIDIIRQAKDDGAPVSCEVTPHHLFLCEDDISDKEYDTNFKMNPPLRPIEDCHALQKALCDGTIDMIATDHAPHAKHEKALEFECAPFGTIGLETAFSLIYTYLIKTKKLSWKRFIEASSINPCKLLHLEPVVLKPDCRADFTVIDTAKKWVVDEECFESKSSNSAFLGKELQGVISDVYVEGKPSLKDRKVMF